MCSFSIILCLIVGLLVSTSLYLWGALLKVLCYHQRGQREAGLHQEPQAISSDPHLSVCKVDVCYPRR
jgi:hypothetical protein